MNINDYYLEHLQDIIASSGAQKDFHETVFTEKMCGFLVDQAVIENFTYAGYKKTDVGLRIDAWDFNEFTEALSLFITDFRLTETLELFKNDDAARQFGKSAAFFKESLKPNFHSTLEESMPAYELARIIHEKAALISKIKFYLLTNAAHDDMSKMPLGKSVIDGRRCTYDVWDISRLHHISQSGTALEDVLIDFQSFISDGVPCLPAFTGSNDLESYLLVLPGSIVAELYEKFGERLYEQNVRTFLQFKGNVNKGIRNTILNVPDMFFAYNNGLTATAEEVKTDGTHQRITSVKNLQIVNGGQTTAALYSTMKKEKADLSKVYVQVKLTVIPHEKIEEFVPKISEYANTQNKVNAADFFSNHPFHLRIEGFSRNLWAKSPDGSINKTHWFYERARGQYANKQAELSPTARNEFLLKNPKDQMFNKTDLAKFEGSMDMKPHLVSMGAQKNFAIFASEIGIKWSKNPDQFNEVYFKNLISKAIIFRHLDKTILGQDWYRGGYKANIVTYSLSKLAHMVKSIGAEIDFNFIWENQKLTIALEKQLLSISEVVYKIIQTPPGYISNVTEWCKREDCWESIRVLNINLRQDFTSELIETKKAKLIQNNGVMIQKLDNGIHNQEYVLEKGGNYWKEIAKFGIKISKLTDREMDILKIACKIPNELPTEKQSVVLLKIEKKLKEEGFRAI